MPSTPELHREPEYDPKTCITAGELRAMGCSIPSTIPDCGWVHRSAVHFGESTSKLEGDDLIIDLSVSFDESFRWVEVKVALG